MSKAMRSHLLAPLGLTLLAGLACDLPQVSPTEIDPTALAQALIDAQNATFVAGLTRTAEVPAPAESDVPTEQATVSPTISVTLTVTPTPFPSVRLTENTHCRSGPLAVYDLVITYLTGQTLQITGKNPAGDYWYVLNPAGSAGDCWLWGRYAEVSGDTALVPVFTALPTPTLNATPTPAWLWAGTWDIWTESSLVLKYSQSLTQSGDQVSGTVNVGAGPESITGTTSQGGLNVSGAIPSRSLTFQWQMLDNGDQFIGSFYLSSINYTGPYCGARNGQPRPSPCQWP